jgi:pantetheine-phosphate adenylyltransferase
LNKKFRIVGIGGTFDEFHKGHRALIMKAFDTGDFVLIGLCTDEFARKLRKDHEVASYEDREKELHSFLRKMHFLNRAKIIPLEDAYGPAASSKEQEAIVVSQETEPVAHKINMVRKLNGLPSLEVIVIDMVPAENHVSVSTTRIRYGEIDREGHLLKNPSSSL